MKKRLFSLILIIFLCMGNTALFSALAFESSTKTEVVNGIFLTTPTNVQKGSNIIFSAYKNNKMVYTDVYSYTDESVIPFYIKNNAEYDSAKIMVWDNTDNLSPLTQAERFEFPEKAPEVEVEQNVKELENVRLICTDEISIDASLQPAASGMLRFKDTNGNIYDLSASDIYMNYDALGRYGTIRYRINSDNSMELISFTVSGTESEIPVKNIKSVSDDKIEYYTDDKYSDYSAVTVNNPTVIYNNRALKNSSDFVELLKKDSGLESDSDDIALNSFGTIRFIDDTSGDLLIINTYKSYYMSTAVDSKNYLITLDGRTEKVYIPITDTENYEILKKPALKTEGTTPTTLTIPTKSIVTLSMSYDNSIGTKYIEYLINSSEKSGTPTETSIPYGGPDKKIVKIGNETFMVTNETAAKQIEVGTSLTYLTDASGAIVYVTSVSSGNKRFGYYAAYVSGDPNEDDSVKIKFYDPEAKEYFTVTISDSANDVMLVANYKSSGKLFWMNITNGKIEKGDIKLAEKITAADDPNATVVYDKGTTIYKSGSQYTLAGANNTNYPSTYGAVFVRPDNMSEKNEFTYSNFNMLTGSSIKYNNPEVYQIKRADRTYVFVMIDKFKGLQQSSNVYVVNEIDPSITKVGGNNVRKVSYYNFKTGVACAEGKELIFLDNVLNTLDLKKGDIFTYYDNSEINGIDFEKTENIFILLRAEELSADKKKAASLQDSLTYEMNASEYQDGFRKFGIYNSDITSPYTNFTLQVPVYVDTQEDNNVMLYFGRSNVQQGAANIDTLDEIVTFVPGETTIATEIAEMFPAGTDPLAWNASNIIEALGEHVTGAKARTSTKLFIYDGSANESERLTVYQKPTIDELKMELDNMINVEMLEHSDAATVAENLENCTLAYTYFSNYSGTLNTLFIIK